MHQAVALLAQGALERVHMSPCVSIYILRAICSGETSPTRDSASMVCPIFPPLYF